MENNQQPQFQFNKVLADQETISYWQQCAQMSRQDVQSLVASNQQLIDQHESDSARITSLQDSVANAEGLIGTTKVEYDEALSQITEWRENCGINAKKVEELNNLLHERDLMIQEGGKRYELLDERLRTVEEAKLNQSAAVVERFGTLLKELDLIQRRSGSIVAKLTDAEGYEINGGDAVSDADLIEEGKNRLNMVRHAVTHAESTHAILGECISAFRNWFATFTNGGEPAKIFSVYNLPPQRAGVLDTNNFLSVDKAPEIAPGTERAPWDKE